MFKNAMPFSKNSARRTDMYVFTLQVLIRNDSGLNNMQDKKVKIWQMMHSEMIKYSL